VVQAVLAAQELNMDDLIGLLVLCSALFFVIVAVALGLGIGHIILVWCGVL
jgi:hypothetical protein